MTGPEAIAFAPDGELLVSDCPAHRIWRIDDAGVAHVWAGIGGGDFLNGRFSGDGGPAIDAGLACPAGMAFDESGTLYFADHANNRVRAIAPDGTITTFAGSGSPGVDQGGFGGDGGPATGARLSEPVGVAFDSRGDLVIADRDNNRIRLVDLRGRISTIAGNGTRASTGDGGPAVRASIDTPQYVAVGPDGAVYFAEAARVRRIDPDGTISTVAGTGVVGFSGDGGPAVKAEVNEPYGIAFDDRGRLYLSELYRIRRVDLHGRVATVAGTGLPGPSGDGGPATEAALSPVGLVFGPDGLLYVADGGAATVRTIDEHGVIETLTAPP
jgi:sugar lactone lactonase YvrE